LKDKAEVIAVQPTVEVVTAGTDWAAIAAAIVTGLAAVIGIAGTAWQAARARAAATADLKTRIDASAAREAEAVRRQAYAEYLTRISTQEVGAILSA
jgi:hypothetical protein